MARGIYPVVAVVDASGARILGDDDVAPRVQAMLAGRLTHPDGPRRRRDRGRCPHERAVLRLARADHARQGGLRAQGHRPRAQRDRHAVRRRHRLRRREPVPRPAQDQRALRPHRLRRRRQVQRVREPAGRRRAPRRHARVLLRPDRRHRAQPGQRVRADPRDDLHRDEQALRGRDRRRRGRCRARGRPALPADVRRVRRRRARLRRDGRPRRTRCRRRWRPAGTRA